MRVERFDNFLYIFYAFGIGPADWNALTTTPVIARLRNGTSTRLPGKVDPASRSGTRVGKERTQRHRQSDFAVSVGMYGS